MIWIRTRVDLECKNNRSMYIESNTYQVVTHTRWTVAAATIAIISQNTTTTLEYDNYNIRRIMKEDQYYIRFEAKRKNRCKVRGYLQTIQLPLPNCLHSKIYLLRRIKIILKNLIIIMIKRWAQITKEIGSNELHTTI